MAARALRGPLRRLDRPFWPRSNGAISPGRGNPAHERGLYSGSLRNLDYSYPPRLGTLRAQAPAMLALAETGLG